MPEGGTLHDAFTDERRDTYDAEKQLTPVAGTSLSPAPWS